jgi:phage gp36-like protein
MSRFITEADYAMQIKQEIIKLLTSPNEWYSTAKLVRAEQTAIAQIRNRIAKRYDCDAIFSPPTGETEGARDQWIVTITIDIALYHLYSQTGMKDIPQHRADRYQDAVDWLKDVGNGTTPADLPIVIDASGDEYSETKIWSRTPENHKW